MNTSIKNIILFLTPFVITVVLFILGASLDFKLFGWILAITVIICICYIIGDALVDIFGD